MKNFYITRANLEKHGWTPGCPACLSTVSGQRQVGTSHTAECRARIEAAVLDDPEEHDRIMRAMERMSAPKRKQIVVEATSTGIDVGASDNRHAKVARAALVDSTTASGIQGRPAGSSTDPVVDTSGTRVAGASKGGADNPNAGASDPKTDAQRQAALAVSATASPEGIGSKRKAPDEGEDVSMSLIYDPDEEVDSLLTSLHEAYMLSVQEQAEQGSRNPCVKCETHWMILTQIGGRPTTT